MLPTARDIAQENFDTKKVMAPQPMEDIMMDIDWTTVPLPARLPSSENDKRKFLSVLEVYIDDFINLIQSTNKDHLLRCSRTILSAISNVFPPPEITNSSMGPAVSVKKLVDEGNMGNTKRNPRVAFRWCSTHHRITRKQGPHHSNRNKTPYP
jgi:hypothetical protein